MAISIIGFDPGGNPFVASTGTGTVRGHLKPLGSRLWCYHSYHPLDVAHRTLQCQCTAPVFVRGGGGGVVRGKPCIPPARFLKHVLKNRNCFLLAMLACNKSSLMNGRAQMKGRGYLLSSMNRHGCGQCFGAVVSRRSQLFFGWSQAI